MPHASRIIVTCLVAALSGVATANAQSDAPWTTVGSAGTVDEQDLFSVDLGSPVAGAISVWAGTVHVRYNVVAVAGLLAGGGFTMTARFLDHGTSERVVVNFKQYALATGSTTTLLTLDSDAFAPSGFFQVQNASTDCAPTLDFVNNSYFMDVEITKTFARPNISVFSPRPALAMIRLTNPGFCVE
jgi:hypothetical protein